MLLNKVHVLTDNPVLHLIAMYFDYGASLTNELSIDIRMYVSLLASHNMKGKFIQTRTI